MTGTDGALAAAETGELALDPFAFHRNVSSRIGGLGGNAPGHDPSYVFHTPYVAAARGPARFRIQFDHLQARRGTLVLRVHMLPDEPGAIARLVNSVRIPLNRLVHQGGVVEITFEGFGGFTFAVMGQVPDETEAHADRLTVTLDRPVDWIGVAQEPIQDIRTTKFGAVTLRATAQLLTLARPTLAVPVSQPCTAEQLVEPIWSACCAKLGRSAAPEPELWPAVFSLQVLLTYGMIAPGARGLLIAFDSAVAAAVHAGGGTIAAAANDTDSVDLELGDAPFDYLCSTAALGRNADAATLTAEVESTLVLVRPGGLAVHVLPFDPQRNGLGSNASGLRRADLERLALSLISRRHEVAQIASGGAMVADACGTIAFGFVLRRARSPL